MTNSALLIIDMQNGLFSIENYPIHDGESLTKNILSLISKAREAHVPIFFIQHNESKGKRLETGSKNWEIYPKLNPKENDINIQKNHMDSFLETNLDEELKTRKITHLIITGLSTPQCIDTTVRSAISHDYEVTLIEDAHSTIDSEVLSASQIIAHHNDVLQFFADIKREEDFVFN
ncbi:hypothetical protein LCGC14_1341890 [marine sediment metagenome]|uniref:Isochorismatase-like domain-containing protein n=1 Tax=marine sediment metagenome TaxID=412755 RepID=A0A0F9JJ35_9ZZZZ